MASSSVHYHQPMKRRRRRNLQPEAPVPPNAAAVLPEEIVADLVNKCNAGVLRDVGFHGATRCAQEQLRQMAEDYFLKMLQTIGLFMQSHRRTRPTVDDFAAMMAAQKIDISALIAELRLRRNPKANVYPLLPPDEPLAPLPDLSPLLGEELMTTDPGKKRIYDHLPPFPSRHTYKTTPVYPERPTEPRMIREKATAEARLAEQALRKLLAVSAGSKGIAGLSDGDLGKKRKERDAMWEKAYEALASPEKKQANGIDEPLATFAEIMNDDGGEEELDKEEDNAFLEVIVNADSQFWRKEKVRRNGGRTQG